MTTGVTSGYKYRAFISYSHRDDEWSSWLLRALENYRIPDHIRKKHPSAPLEKRLGRFFRDRDELPATGHMTDHIFEAIADSEFMIVICSPEAAQSKLVNREIAEFKRLRGESNILCLIVAGVPFAENPEEECFPEALRLKFTTSGQRSGLAVEGLAADAREDGDGKRQALFKLVAGMLGIGLNDLVRRENQGRHRRITAFAAAASLGFAAMGALAFEASRARDDAEQALKLANLKSAEARKTMEELEGLTVFIMSAVYDELLTAGSLSVLERTSSKIVDQLNGIGFENMSMKRRAELIASYLRLGQVLERQGESTRARQYFDTAAVWAKDLFEQYPNDATAIGRYQTALFFTGYLSQRQGDYLAAERDFTERLRLTRIGLETKPSSVDVHRVLGKDNWEEEVADSEANLCYLQYIPLGKPEEALKNCKSSVALRRLVVENLPDVKEHWVNLGSSYFHLANTYLALGRNVEAKEAFLNRFTIYANILEREPQNYRIIRRAAMTKQRLAQIEDLQGNTEKAIEMLEESKRQFDILTAQDPANVMWLADSADVYRNYAAVLMKTPDLTRAGHILAIADDQIMRAISSDMSRANRRLSAHRTRLLKAQLADKHGDADVASALLREAAAHFEGEDTSYLSVPGALEHASELYLFKGNMLMRAGDEAGARTAWQHVVNLYETATATKTPVFRQSVARAYTMLGETGQAEAVIARKNVAR
ncbi:toll/interleukin-1 receptor domain-containing protein [Kordiimonas aestuarii]|uniref:toll/interleukin-1 receptor domain-containing protein n=1 Tax=Kordiimonas aestuarii TaxID=1005925 RepID=UPI0021D25C01|nr:toll/interleukin-1 receptor domain-containing protein [Kordiimonas aestuarii]